MHFFFKMAGRPAVSKESGDRAAKAWPLDRV
jgi:hypothetical protein